MERLSERVEQHDALSSSGASYLQTDAGSVVGGPDAAQQGIPIKLTGLAFVNGLPAYSWVEVEPLTTPGDPSGRLYQEKEGGQKGTVTGVNGETATSQPAYESSGNAPLSHSNTAGLLQSVVDAYRGYGDYYVFSLSSDTQMILCNSDAPDANGCYDGILQMYDPVARTWVNVQTGVCLVDGSGGSTNTFTGSLPNGTGGAVTVTRGLVTASLLVAVGSNQMYCSPATPGVSGTPAYRALVYQDLPRLFYSATGIVTVANSTTETSLLTSTQTFAANTFRQIGRGFRISQRGFWSTDAAAAGTVRIRVKLGTAVIADSGAFTAPNGLANAYWSLELDATFWTVGSGGIVVAMGWFKWEDAATGQMRCKPLKDQSATVDTTASRELILTWQWGTADADNTTTTATTIVELLP